MKKKFLCMIFIVGLVSTSYSESFIEEYLTGIWYNHPSPKNVSVKEYSWGMGYSIPNFILNIDLYNDNNSIFVPILGGPFTIEEIKTIKERELYEINIYFYRGDFNVYYHMHVSPDESYIWFEAFEGNNADLISTEYVNGETWFWYKISGPDIEIEPSLIKEYKSEQAKKAQENIENPKGKDGIINDNNVHFRIAPNLDSEIIAVFNKGDKLLVQGILVGKQKIGDVEALWYKVYHSEFGEGWMFGAYVDVEGVKTGESIFD